MPQTPQQRTLIFLIHGFMGHPREFDPLAEQLEHAGFDIHCVCLPEHGDEPGNLGRIRWTDLIDACQMDLERLQESYDSIHLVGFSLGGALGIIISQQNPAAFHSVTLVATPYKSVFNWDYSQYHFKNFFSRILPGAQYLYQWDTGYPKPILLPYDVPRFYGQMDSLFREVEQSVAGMVAPTLLIHSPYDLTVPYDHSEWLYDMLPCETSFVTLLNCGHQVFPFNVRGTVTKAILDHVLLTSPQMQPIP